MRKLLLSAAALALLPLAGCATDGYGYYGLSWSSYPYDVWYDGYYGPIYDGYWGTDGFFWYRPDRSVNRYRRGEHSHFRRGDAPPSGNFRRYEGQIQPPERGMRAPNLPRRAPGDQNRQRDRRGP
ncbi:MAG: hypothetical protein AB7F98_16340 [Novosphingobium sp.]